MMAMIRLLVACAVLLAPFAVRAATIVYHPRFAQIFVVGKIVYGDFARFEQALKASKGDVTAVNVISLGGSVSEAIEIGHLIRKLSLGVNVPNLANYAPQARTLVCTEAASIAPSPCTCVSACFLIYAGGVARSGNDIHIHRIRFDDNSYGNLSPVEAQAQYSQAMQMVHDYLKEMEIPDSIFEKMANMPSYTTEQLDWQVSNTLTWPPSFAEWLFARCGNPYQANSSCFSDQQFATAKKAVAAYISQH
jgi:hypothetical protein